MNDINALAEEAIRIAIGMIDTSNTLGEQRKQLAETCARFADAPAPEGQEDSKREALKLYRQTLADADKALAALNGKATLVTELTLELELMMSRDLAALRAGAAQRTPAGRVVFTETDVANMLRSIAEATARRLAERIQADTAPTSHNNR